MTMRGRTVRTALSAAVGVALGVSADAIAAQTPRSAAPRDDVGVEHILRQRDRLQLTEEQIRSLNEIRLESLDARIQADAVRQRARSDFVAGEITRSEMRSAMEGRRPDARERGAALRERLQAVLTEDQRTRISESRRSVRGPRASRGARGPRGVRGQRGARAPRSFRGMRGTRTRPGFDRETRFRRGRPGRF